jgi:hypothetical protein
MIIDIATKVQVRIMDMPEVMAIIRSAEDTISNLKKEITELRRRTPEGIAANLECHKLLARNCERERVMRCVKTITPHDLAYNGIFQAVHRVVYDEELK